MTESGAKGRHLPSESALQVLGFINSPALHVAFLPLDINREVSLGVYPKYVPSFPVQPLSLVIWVISILS